MIFGLVIMAQSQKMAAKVNASSKLWGIKKVLEMLTHLKRHGHNLKNWISVELTHFIPCWFDKEPKFCKLWPCLFFTPHFAFNKLKIGSNLGHNSSELNIHFWKAPGMLCAMVLPWIVHSIDFVLETTILFRLITEWFWKFEPFHWFVCVILHWHR